MQQNDPAGRYALFHAAEDGFGRGIFPVHAVRGPLHGGHAQVFGGLHGFGIPRAGGRAVHARFDAGERKEQVVACVHIRRNRRVILPGGVLMPHGMVADLVPGVCDLLYAFGVFLRKFAHEKEGGGRPLRTQRGKHRIGGFVAPGAVEREGDLPILPRHTVNGRAFGRGIHDLRGREHHHRDERRRPQRDNDPHPSAFFAEHRALHAASPPLLSYAARAP